MSFFERPRAERGTDTDVQALRRALRPDDPQSIKLLQNALERAGMKGAFVPVETSQGAVENEGQSSETRWVEWKRVYDSDGKEIPGSIEKVLRVKLRTAPLYQLIAVGNYNATQEGIAEGNVTVEESEGEKEIFLSRFNVGARESVTTQHVLDWMVANNLRASTFKELLAVGEQLPQKESKAIMVALGSICQPPRSSPYVVQIDERYVSHRGLSLVSPLVRWDKEYLFPTSRK